MPHAILRFKLPEEKIEFTAASKGMNAYLALHDVAQELRKKIKYDNLPSDQVALLEKLQEDFDEILVDRNVDLDEVS